MKDEGGRMKENQDVEIATNTPQQFAADIRADIAKWDQLIKSLGIRLD